MNLPELLKLVKRVTTKGLICLKGGDLTDEITAAIAQRTQVKDISQYFGEVFFQTKKVVYTKMNN